MKKIKARIRVTRRGSKKFMIFLSSLTILVTCLGVMSLIDNVNAKQITINDNNFKYTYETSKKTVEMFLKENDIVLSEYDRVNVDLEQEIVEGMTIKIRRAVPIKLILNGKVETIYTACQTVDEFLESQNIKVLPSDYINMTFDTLIIKNLELIINLYDTEILTVDEEIPYGTKYELSSLLPSGTTQVKTKGQYGVRHVTYEIRYLNGKEINRYEMSEELIASPIDEVIVQGTKEVLTLGGKNYNVAKILQMTATGYDNCIKCTGKEPGDWGYGITASGIPTRHGVVAVDKSIIPLGTKLYVEGYGEAIAADTGSAIKGYRIDLYFDTHELASNYGVHKNINVYILEN